MSEVAFPLLGAAIVMVFVLPACALLAKAALMLLERHKASGPLHGLAARYVVLTAASILPLAWFLSAGFHQAEAGESVLACLFDHHTAELCFEPGLFALTLALVVLGLGVAAIKNNAAPRVSTAPAAVALTRRLDAILQLHVELRGLQGRIRIVDVHGFSLSTTGLIRPTIVIGLAYAASISDAMLASALGHEGEHVRSRDPLRYFILNLALAINPCSRFLLAPHATRWYAAREVHCDREAVIRGASPLSLAEAIVRAARPSIRELVALGARETAVLKFRIGMLFAFAEHAPTRCCHRSISGFPVAFALLIVALLLPHQTGTAALDAIHVGAEHALTYFWQ